MKTILNLKLIQLNYKMRRRWSTFVYRQHFCFHFHCFWKSENYKGYKDIFDYNKLKICNVKLLKLFQGLLNCYL